MKSTLERELTAHAVAEIKSGCFSLCGHWNYFCGNYANAISIIKLTMYAWFFRRSYAW